MVFFPLTEIGGLSDCAGSIRDHLNAKVHLEPGDAHTFFALLHALGVDLGILRLGSVRVNTNLVAKLSTAYHRVNRSVVNLASYVPQRHLDGAYSSALPRMPAKLFDLAENSVELQRVLSQNAALEKKSIGGTGPIANLA